VGETLPTVDFEEQLGRYKCEEALRLANFLSSLCFLILNNLPPAEH